MGLYSFVCRFSCTLCICLLHTFLTLPSTLYHSLYNLYMRRFHTHSYITLPDGSHDVIICIHGRNAHPADFNYFINKIKPHTDYQILSFYLGPTVNSSIYKDVDALYEQVLPLMDKINNIILIGLSKGGLIAVQYAIKHPTKIKKIITVSSPLNGTNMANYILFNDTVKKELSYESEFTQDVMKKSEHLPIYSIVPRFDSLIIPNHSAFFRHSFDKCYFYMGYYSHSGILYAPEVINTIIAWIK